jgi:succinate dehydrogenase/fumarate reductase flavoprotein subunit
MQLRPTALDAGLDSLPLVSEAVRGEGAILVDETGTRFLAGMPGAELAPNDVVARGIWQQLQAGYRVFLDARGALGGFSQLLSRHRCRLLPRGGGSGSAAHSGGAGRALPHGRRGDGRRLPPIPLRCGRSYR